MLPLALAATLICTAPRVHDGDSINMCGTKVRIWGEDAAELNNSPRCRLSASRRLPLPWACDPAAMASAIPARDRLISLTRGEVVCEPMDVDRYRRVVARCSAAGVDVGRVLVREGLARDYTRYSHGAYLADETRARRGHIGMWARLVVLSEQCPANLWRLL